MAIHPSFLSQFPDLSLEWHPDNPKGPDEYAPRSGQSVLWRGKCGHSWPALISNRGRGSGCPYCSDPPSKALPGVTDLATLYPVLASEWSPRNSVPASESLAGTSKKAWWQGPCGHEWEAVIRNRTIRGDGCPLCSGHRAIAGKTDLATLRPDLAAQWHPEKNDRTPAEVTAQSNTSAWWICSLGHEWQAKVSNRYHGTGCPTCSGKKTLSGFNDLATTNPELIKEWDDTHRGPQDVTAGSHYEASWRCSHGHTWVSAVFNRAGRSPQGCPDCVITTSAGESSLYEFIKSFEPDARQSVRTILKGKELDIYIPSLRTAIEYNGLYWHSEAAGRGQKYHWNKLQAAKKANITLLQVWEDDWRDKRPLVEAMIRHKLGASKQSTVYARKTNHTVLTYDQASQFLFSNHLQGASRGTYYLGLTEELTHEIIAVMTLRRVKNELFIDRFATSRRVPGGFQKLLSKALELCTDIDRFITFADLSHSSGDLYLKSGFIQDRILPPDYKYLFKYSRVHKFNFRLGRFRVDPALKFEEGKTERELAQMNNMPRIWDSGKIRYVYNLTDEVSSDVLTM